MSVDWAATGTWMQAWAGFAQAAAVAFAAWKAADTFLAWRRQRIEERRLTTAETILTLVYRLQRAFSVIRNSVTSEVALEEARRRLLLNGFDFSRHPPDKQARIVEAQVIFDRINQFANDWDQLSTIAPLAKALFGEPLERGLDNIWKQRTAVQVAAESYISDDGNDANFTQQVRDTIWEDRGSARGRSDPVKMALQEIVVNLDAVLLPIIRAD